MKKEFITLVGVVCLLSVGGLHAQISSRSLPIKSHNNVFNRTMVCSGGSYENFGNVDIGYSSQIFEDENSAYNSELADDFKTPAQASVLCNISVEGATLNGVGFAGNAQNTIRVNIYNDNAGKPGDVIFSRDFPASTLDPENTGSFNLSNFDDSPVLTANTTYWISVRAAMGFADSGQWYWKYAPISHGNTWKWRNPGDGFETGCTNWQDAKDCLNTEGVDASIKVEFSNFLSVHETLEKGVNIYPNPATREVKISVPAGIKIEKVEVLDLSGKASPLRIVSHTLDVSSLQTGVYMLAISTNKGKIIRKLLKK